MIPDPRLPLTEREAPLQLWLLRASHWLLLTGIIQILQTPLVSIYLNLRYIQDSMPQVKALGLTQLCLGLLANRAARNPKPQPLLVDLLGLFFIARISFALALGLNGAGLYKTEWLQMAADAVFGGSLALLRLRSTELPGSKPFWQMDFEQWRAWARENKRAWWRDSNAVNKSAKKNEDSKRTRLSEPVPRLDK